MDWLLSDVQRKAVTTTEGPLLIFAGAGSGKTRVITYRIAYLILEKMIKPERILAVTFTNKSAKEMKERIGPIINNDKIAKKLTIATFHSLGLQILKKEYKLINYPANFVIYTPYEQTELLKRVMDEKGISRERFSARGLLAILSNLKNSPELFNNDQYFYNIRHSVARDVYPAYNNALRLAGAMDFDDLIVKVIDLFEKHDQVRKKYADIFRYIMVDEYQDTNNSQYRLIRFFSSVHGNLCVVGDDDQSIYSWRGAKVENILNFNKDFEGCKTVKLEQNYRSIDQVVNAASRLINFNETRAAKTVFTEKKAGSDDGIEVLKKLDEMEEAEYVALKALELAEHGKMYSDMAIIVRANHQTRAFEIAFSKHHIPFRIIGGKKFFENKEIKDLLAYLRIVVNKNDEISLRRIINFPTRGIGIATQEKLFDIAKNESVSVIDILAVLDSYEDFKPAQKKSLLGFYEIYKDLYSKMSELEPVEFSKYLIKKIGIEPEIVRNAENETVVKIKFENINEFTNSISYYSSERDFDAPLTFFADFINAISLIQSGEEESKGNAVNIITAHSAKGLEFDTVFLIGFYMGGFPNRRAMEEGNLQEERRLCYVAITRAKNKLFITIPSMVRNFGKSEPTTPSIFLNEAGLSSLEYNEKPRFKSTEELLGPLMEKLNRLKNSG